MRDESRDTRAVLVFFRAGFCFGAASHVPCSALVEPIPRCRGAPLPDLVAETNISDGPWFSRPSTGGRRVCLQRGNGKPKESRSLSSGVPSVLWVPETDETETAPDTGSQDGFEILTREIPADWPSCTETVSRSQHALRCLEKNHHDMQQQQLMPITPDRNIVAVGQQPITRGTVAVCESGSILSRTATGVTRAALRKQFVAQRPNHRQPESSPH